MMARQPNPDLTTTLTMLHATVLNTDKNLRDALDKSVEKLESAGQAAHDKATKEVVDELSRMRANFRDVHNKLNSSGDTLDSAVHEVVAQLRTELREVRDVLADFAPPAAAPVLREASGIQEDHTGLQASPVTTVTETDEAAEEPALHTAIPAQRIADQDVPSAPALSVGEVRQAVREVFTEELAPMLALLTTPDSHSGGPADDQQNTPAGLLEALGEVKAEIDNAREEARASIASVQQEITDLRTTMEKLLSQPDATTTNAEENKEHSALLKTAARASSASLLCHRDIWEFITAHAGRHPHFRVPPQVAAEGDERIRAALSGRSLIALLISLHSLERTAADGDGDRELAATLYERIEKSLTGLSPGGEPVTITLDDRTPATEDSIEADGEPDSTGIPPTSTEQDTEPDEDAGPATQ
ncbi:hypothetical protein [Streptomyces lydicus]|uniref:hypothetical protein n=1 Tax=Streptomyces lydicus TaxID=47763 RepID=UPI001F511525|nr:hypothetical protein [Streptomyces lydicus]MCZ1006522.1 hypothetical protein [Streptomyces lydicus]